jgi:hypothetical protein
MARCSQRVCGSKSGDPTANDQEIQVKVRLSERIMSGRWSIGAMGIVSKSIGGQRAMLLVAMRVIVPVNVPGTMQLLHHVDSILRGWVA